MIYFKNKLRFLHNAARDHSGSFLLTSALLIPVLFGAVGLSIDVSHIFLTRSSLQAANDSAIMAVASRLSLNRSEDQNDIDSIKTMFRNHLQCSLNNKFPEDVAASIAQKAPIEIRKISSSPAVYRVAAAPEYDMPLNKFSLVSLLAGRDSIKVSVEAITRARQAELNTPLSLEFVLDVSGSMTGPLYSKCQRLPRERIVVLKEAVFKLMDRIQSKENPQDFVRMGVTAFSGKIESSSPLAWGKTTAAQCVSRLKCGTFVAGTNSEPAVKRAYDELTSKKEQQEHIAKNHQTFRKIMIFMTDGVNTHTSSDQKTLAICNKAKKEGVEIFTISLLGGLPNDKESKKITKRANKLLTACASSPDRYYDTDDMDTFLAAFDKIGTKILDQQVILER
ncbi:vWA domain-containing protein [Liberibacter crescens]|uniref:vWA domain-containing protein n=1 Tax=Liberibacter crescens TaxID=1273132 RepID=UPI000762E5ED|nr:TadE/TadG family type IV pilus assembly protein [Liberibacter crescens]AMC12851.1 hypothetical protein RL73_04015 [Liberibacter crescens]